MSIQSQTPSLRILNATYNAENDPYSWGPGIRNHYILHYIKSGSGIFVCNSQKFLLSAGQCFLVIPNTVCAYYPDKNDPWEYCWIDFSGYEAKTIAENCSFSVSHPITDTPDKALSEYFEASEKYYNSPTASNSYFNFSCFYAIFGYLSKKYPVKEKKSADSLLENVKAYIETRYSSVSLNVETLSRIFSVNRSSLYRCFVKHLKTTPNRYIIKTRMEQAKELLKGTDLSIKSVAQSVGYTDQFWFSKLFKKEIGLSPSEYREKYKI